MTTWRHHRAPPPPRTDRGQRGTGLLGTAAGTAAFLVFLLFAVQLTVTLYATSTVNAAGYDAARRVASMRIDHDDPAAVRRAAAESERHLRDLLGDLGRTARVTWTVDADHVRLRIVADSPGVLPSTVRDTAHLRHIDRTFVVRVERGPT